MNLYEKIEIKSTPNADTRSATDFTRETLEKETADHIEAVFLVMNSLSKRIKLVGFNHDWTKIHNMDQFFEDFKSMKQGAEFKKLPWWQIHLTERHHLNDKCPDDVNLIDVLEMIADGVCAGLARKGSTYPIEISSDILQKAVANTQKMIEESIIIDKTKK